MCNPWRLFCLVTIVIDKSYTYEIVAMWPGFMGVCITIATLWFPITRWRHRDATVLCQARLWRKFFITWWHEESNSVRPDSCHVTSKTGLWSCYRLTKDCWTVHTVLFWTRKRTHQYNKRRGLEMPIIQMVRDRPLCVNYQFLVRTWL